MMSRFILSAVLSSLMLAPMAASAQQVLTNVAPPAPIVENQPAAPGPNHTWVGGYWSWNGSQYGWTAGHWEPTPATAQGWDAPQWEHEGQGYRFRPGHWRGRNGATVNAPPQGVVVGTPVGMGLPPPAMAVPPPVQTVVTMAPPAPVNESPTAAPGPNYTWVPGFWNWNGNQYTWTGGHWEQPPAPAQAWQAPQWDRDGQGYRFRPGRWFRRDGQQPMPVAMPVAPPPVVAPPPMVVAQPTTVFVPVAPPRLRMERRTQRAQPGQVWVPGSWSWNGTQHVWTAGRWEAPPRPAARWNPARWVRQGRGWQMNPGAWR